MSQAPLENEPQGHPAWQTILDQLPDDLHGLVRPELEKWDRGVEEKLQGLRSQYDPYKNLVENNVPPEFIQQALYLASELQNNPHQVISQAIEAFNYEIPNQAVGNSQPDDDDSFDWTNDSGVDITQHPQFKAMYEQMEALQGRFTEQDNQSQAAAQQKQMEDYLGQLTTEHGEFDQLYVTALIAQGVDGVEAVKQYQNTVNQAAARLAGTTQNPAPTPVVMGGDGVMGSGMPDQAIRMGSLDKTQMKDLVVEMLRKAEQQT